MTNETTPSKPADGSCARTALLLSLLADDAATPSQRAEIDAHLPRCAACRRAAHADAAVRARLVELSTADAAPRPAWLDGFAARTAAHAVALAREARAQNRLLWMSAAAALLVAVTAQFAFPGGDASSRFASSDSAVVPRDAARTAVIRPPLLDRSHEGK